MLQKYYENLTETLYKLYEKVIDNLDPMCYSIVMEGTASPTNGKGKQHGTEILQQPTGQGRHAEKH